MEKLGDRFESYINEHGQLAEIELLQKVYEKIRKYEDLEERGRLVEFPCRAGDAVYFIYRGEVASSRVKRFYQCVSGGWGMVLCDMFPDLHSEQIGKTVFFSKTEADEALERINADVEQRKLMWIAEHMGRRNTI